MAGAGGGTDTCYSSPGGVGGIVQSILTVTPGTVLCVFVGITWKRNNFSIVNILRARR